MAIILCPECQKEVSDNAIMCPTCGYNVKEHFDKIRQYEHEKELCMMKEKHSKAVKKQLKIWIPICITIFLLIIIFALNYMVLSKRTTFHTEKEMLAYLTANPNWKLDNDYNESWFVFYDTGFAENISNDGFCRGEIIEMHPWRGYFNFGSAKYIILSNGQIYYKSDFIANCEEYYDSSVLTLNIESAVKALKLTAEDIKFENSCVTGELQITNTGKKTYEYVRAEIVAYDKDNNIIKDSSLLTFHTTAVNDPTNYNSEIEPGTKAVRNVFFEIPDKNFIPVKYEIYIAEYSTPIDY